MKMMGYKKSAKRSTKKAAPMKKMAYKGMDYKMGYRKPRPKGKK